MNNPPRELYDEIGVELALAVSALLSALPFCWVLLGPLGCVDNGTMIQRDLRDDPGLFSDSHQDRMGK